MRSGWRKANLTPRIHSSFDPSCRLMTICPGGTLTGVGGWSSPDFAGFFCLWRSDRVVWSEENAVSGLVDESCGVWWLCVCVKVVSSQSTWWMSLSIWNSPSTVPMTATCRWTSVRDGRNVFGDQCGM